MQCIKTQIEWLKRITEAVTGTCIFGDAATFINEMSNPHPMSCLPAGLTLMGALV